MQTDIQITILGAGSAQFSGGLIRDLCLISSLHGSHVVLMDIDQQRLAMVTRLAERLAGELNADLRFTRTTDRQTALQGADFVINTAQVGGHAWTEAQRDLAEQHGYYRGVRLHEFGQAAFFLDVARDMERICPNAWLLQSANPVFEGCTLMTRETAVKVVGLCHGGLGYRDMVRVLGLSLDDVTVRMVGFNHWLWLTDFRYGDADAYPLLDQWIATQAEDYWAHDDRSYSDNQMSRAAIHQYRLFGLMPIGDTVRLAGWWYHTDLATKQRWYGHLGGFDSEIGWRQYLAKMQQNVRRVERTALDRNTPVREIFKPVPSDEQIVPVINAMVHHVEGRFQVNIPNRGGILPGFPDDLVVECQGLVNADGIHGLAAPPLPRKLMLGEMLPRWRRAELVIEAIRSRDRDLVLLYLLESHHAHSLEQAQGLLDAWLADPRNDAMATFFT